MSFAVTQGLFLSSYFVSLLNTTALRIMQLQLGSFAASLLVINPSCSYTLFDDQFLLSPSLTYKSCLICYFFLNSFAGSFIVAERTIQLGLFFQLQSQDLIITFVCFELINIGSYAVICTYSSGLRYIITSLLLSTFFCLGIVLVYADNGHTTATDLNLPIWSVFQLKLGILPFHQLTADLYDSCPTKIMMLMQLPIKLGILLYISGQHIIPSYAVSLLFVGIIVASLSTCYAYTFKRFQALSSTSYLTLLLIGSYAVPSYAVVYTLTLSLIISAYQRGCPSVTVLFQSIAGLPPFLGFYLKLWLINDLISRNLLSIVLIFLASSLIQTANYLERSPHKYQSSKAAASLLSSSLSGVLFFWSVISI